LVGLAQAGDRPAFDRLVLRHQQMVFGMSLRMLGNYAEAQDVAQEAFVHAFRSIHAFRGGAKFSTWLGSITINLCRNRRRWWARHRRESAVSLDEPRARQGEAGSVGMGELVPDPAPSPAEAAGIREQHHALLVCLQKLPAADREVVILRDMHGHSYEEIADLLGCRLGTVKSRLSRARYQLRTLMDLR
jgi:RNA polymerase sigma-70 factor (ECF subfamily)